MSSLKYGAFSGSISLRIPAGLGTISAVQGLPLAAKKSRIYPAFFSSLTQSKLSSVTLAKYLPSAPR